MTLAPAPFATSIDALPVVERDAYTIIGERARGGVGRILEAVDARLGRRVAIKELLVRGRENDARFLREARIASSLQHPATIPVYQVARWPDGTPFLVMKLVEGRSLEAVAAEGSSTEARLALVPHVLRIAEAMAYAHAVGVVHRDIKPANVLVGPFGETVLIDWGMGKERAGGDEYDDGVTGGGARGGSREVGATVTGAILGTPAYMAPEQAAGQVCDERADIYAIGALLYHALSGAPPYAGSTATAILDSVLRRAPRRLADRAAALPPELIAIVERAMARDPARRYATAAALADDLRRFLSGQLVSAHRYTRASLIGRWVRRHRALVALAALFVVVGALAGALAVRSILRARDDAEERTRRLVVSQARSLVEHDPTSSVAWLKLLDGRAAERPTAHALAVEAASLGVASYVIPRERVAGTSAFSADGAVYLDVAGGVARVIELSTGRERFRHTWRGAELVGQLSAEAPYVALWSADGAHTREVRVFDWKRGERVLTTKSHGESPPVALVDPPALVVCDEDGALVVNDLVAGQQQRITPRRIVRELLSRPERHLLAEIGASEVWAWDTTTWTARRVGELLKEDIRQVQAGFASRARIDRDENGPEPGARAVIERRRSEATVVGVAALADSVSVPIARGFEIFEPAGTRSVEIPQEMARVRSAVGGRRGFAASCHSDGARVWRRERLIAWLRTPTTCHAVRLSPDNEWLAVVGEDRVTRLFRVPNAAPRSIELSAPMVSLEYGATGEVLAGATRDGDAVWMAAGDWRPHRVGRFDAGDQLLFSTSGRYLFVGGGRAALRSIELATERAAIVAGGVRLATPLPNDDLAVIEFSALSRVHADGTGRTHLASLPSTAVAAVAGAGWIAIADDTNRICVYHLEHERELGCLDGEGGAAMALAARGPSLVRLVWGRATQWRPLAGGGRRTMPLRDVEPERALFIDDELVAAWGRANVGLLAPETGTWRPLVGHRDRVRSAVVVPGQRALVTAAHDGTVRLWDADSGLSTASAPRCRGPVRGLDVHPSGREAAILCDDDTLILWDLGRAPRAPTDAASWRVHLDGLTSAVVGSDGAVASPP